MPAQKLKGLSTYCEIKDVSITQQDATIKVLLFSNQENNVIFGLQFYILDEDKQTEELINTNTYWVEKFQPSFESNNNIQNNIDINLFKELLFKVDITDKNRGSFQVDRWIRNVRILIKAEAIIGTSTVNTGDIVYRSESISLVSGIVIVPDLKQISIKSINTDGNLSDVEELLVSIYYNYGIENDFNYNNKNIQYFFRLINPKTFKVITGSQKILTENGTLTDGTLTDQDPKLGVLKYTFTSLKLRTPIIVSISIRDLKGNIIKAYNKLYIPSVPKNKVYVKFNGVIKEVEVMFSNFTETSNYNIDRLYLNNGTVDYKPFED
jgi:hypothetical protein